MIHDPAIVDAVRVGWFINECTPWLSGCIGSPSQGAKHREVLVRLGDGEVVSLHGITLRNCAFRARLMVRLVVRR